MKKSIFKALFFIVMTLCISSLASAKEICLVKAINYIGDEPSNNLYQAFENNYVAEDISVSINHNTWTKLNQIEFPNSIQKSTYMDCFEINPGDDFQIRVGLNGTKKVDQSVITAKIKFEDLPNINQVDLAITGNNLPLNIVDRADHEVSRFFDEDHPDFVATEAICRFTDFETSCQFFEPGLKKLLGTYKGHQLSYIDKFGEPGELLDSIHDKNFIGTAYIDRNVFANGIEHVVLNDNDFNQDVNNYYVSLNLENETEKPISNIELIGNHPLFKGVYSGGIIFPPGLNY